MIRIFAPILFRYFILAAFFLHASTPTHNTMDSPNNTGIIGSCAGGAGSTAIAAPLASMSQEAMRILFEMHCNNTLCDGTITLDAVDGDGDGGADDDGLPPATVLNVHRAILCASSDYFRAAFTSSLNGGRVNLRVPGIRAPIMRRLIDYAYLRRCELDEKCVHELFVMADYVAMCGLMRQCREFMVGMLRAENCVGLMLFGR